MIWRSPNRLGWLTSESQGSACLYCCSTGGGKGGSGKGCELPLLQHLGSGKGQCCIVVTLLLRARLQHWGGGRGVLHCCSAGEWWGVCSTAQHWRRGRDVLHCCSAGGGDSPAAALGGTPCSHCALTLCLPPTFTFNSISFHKRGTNLYPDSEFVLPRNFPHNCTSWSNFLLDLVNSSWLNFNAMSGWMLSS